MACGVDVERHDLAEEVDLLQAIYIHELELQGPVERPNSLTLFLHPSTGDDDDTLKYVCLSLHLAIPQQYPCIIPEISIQNPRGLSEAHITSIEENLFELAKDRTGSPMLYDLIEYTRECLTDNNIPSCPCVICLEHFHEESTFIKTKCYHYFHSFCLRKYVDHFLKENEKLLCPMCRLEINIDMAVEREYEQNEEKFIYKPDLLEQKAQQERQRILEYQKEKGGVINIEEERDKYLIGIKNMKIEPVGENNVQLKSISGSGKHDTVKIEERQNEHTGVGLKRDKSGTGDRTGKNGGNSRHHKDNKQGGRGEIGIKKEYPRKQDYENPRNCRSSRTESKEGIDGVPRGTKGMDGVPRRREGTDGVPQRTEGIDGVQRRTNGIDGVPRRTERTDSVPRRTEGTDGVPMRTKGTDGVPKPKGIDGVPRRTEGVDGVPRRTEGVDGVPRRTEGIRRQPGDKKEHERTTTVKHENRVQNADKCENNRQGEDFDKNNEIKNEDSCNIVSKNEMKERVMARTGECQEMKSKNNNVEINSKYNYNEAKSKNDEKSDFGAPQKIPRKRYRRKPPRNPRNNEKGTRNDSPKSEKSPAARNTRTNEIDERKYATNNSGKSEQKCVRPFARKTEIIEKRTFEMNDNVMGAGGDWSYTVMGAGGTGRIRCPPPPGFEGMFRNSEKLISE